MDRIILLHINHTDFILRPQRTKQQMPTLNINALYMDATFLVETNCTNATPEETMKFLEKLNSLKFVRIRPKINAMMIKKALMFFGNASN